MAGLKIIWSEEAVQCFHQISSFYCSQAGNSAYVRKLLQMITGTLRLVSSYPYMYRAASAPDTRVQSDGIKRGSPPLRLENQPAMAEMDRMSGIKRI